MTLFLRASTVLLAVFASSAFADDRVQAHLLEPKAAPQAGHRVYFVQIGTYSTLKQAAYLRGILQNVGPTRVEKAGDTYRVLVGRFGDADEAEGFIQEHRLRTLFPGLWVNVLTSDISGGPGNGATEIPLNEQERDARTVAIDLYCGKDQKRGKYVAQFTQEPGQPTAAPSMDVHWSCITGNQEINDWADKDRERNPSFVGVTPITAMGSFSRSGGAIGELGLTHFSYGLQLSAFKTFGGVGPIAEYRFFDARYGGGSGNPTPLFNLQQSALVGVRLPFAHRFEVEPVGGLASQPFLLGDSLTEASFRSIWTPQIGGRVRVRAIELSNRGSIDLSGGYTYFLSGTNDDVTSSRGSAITAQLRARHFTQDTWGAEWFFEFNSISRAAEGVTQSETLFRFGLSFLLEIK